MRTRTSKFDLLTFLVTVVVLGMVIVFSFGEAHAQSAADCQARAQYAERSSGGLLGGAARGAARGALFGAIIGGRKRRGRAAIRGGLGLLLAVHEDLRVATTPICART